MAMGTERSKPLHNFTLPCDLRWGYQRFLRCMKVDSGGQISPNHRADGNSSGSSDHRHHLLTQHRRVTRHRGREMDNDSSFRCADGSARAGRSLPPPAVALGGGREFGCDIDGGIAATREKVMLDLQTAADKMKNAFFKDGGPVPRQLLPQSLLPPTSAAESEVVIHRPWNLRSGRALSRTLATGFATAAGGGNGGAGTKGLRVDAPRPNPGSSQMRSPAAAAAQNSPIHRSDGRGVAVSGGVKERTKFSVALSKREIEEDFFTIAGRRPPRRPKKRPRTVQKQLDTLFPGLWLSEVTPEMYEVPEAAP